LIASIASGTRIRRVHSFFIERMNRLITEMLPCCWTAPKRDLMPRRWHQFLNESHQNCVPLSEITYLGCLDERSLAFFVYAFQTGAQRLLMDEERSRSLLA
jgi:hypothetical protein